MSIPVRSQAVAVPKEQNPQSAKQAQSHAGPALTEEQQLRVVEGFVFSNLIERIGWDDIRAQHAIEIGKKPDPRESYKNLGIAKEDEDTIYRVLLDAVHRKRALDSQFLLLRDAIDEHYDAAQVAQREELEREIAEIPYSAIDRLKQELGEDTFNKLNRCLLQMAAQAGQIKVSANDN